MKKLVSLAMALLLTLSSFLFPALAEEHPTVKVGTLSMLNLTEAEAQIYRQAAGLLSRQLEKENYIQSVLAGKFGENRLFPVYEITYYENLDSLLMALNAGQIKIIEIYESVARYLVANNPELLLLYTFDHTRELNAFARIAVSGLLSNDFAFMFMEDNAALRDKFDAALASITEEEMNQLIQDHITAAIDGKEVRSVEMPVIDDAETIRVAVTGALPPMDYVTPDGSPAGFSTAVLAEISRRINRNIELVVVESAGRAAALASGAVDVVFWTRTNSEANRFAALSEKERIADRKAFEETMSGEEIEIDEKVKEMIDLSAFGQADMPEGTIITAPYFSDIIIPVTSLTQLANY